MLSLLAVLLLALAPVPLVYFLYLRDFLSSLRYLEHAQSFLVGIVTATVVFAIVGTIQTLLGFENALVKGFIGAALLEKISCGAAILIQIQRRRDRLVILETVVQGLLVGLGFALIENVAYSLTQRGTLVPRLLSAVPLHASTCGIMGYYFGLAHAHTSRVTRPLILLQGLFIAVFFHGCYDTLLFLGDRWTYLAGPLLVSLVLILDYVLAKSQTYPPLASLRALGLHFEEWEAIQREPQFDRWILRSSGAANPEHSPFFQWQPGTQRIVVALIVLAAVIAYLAFGSAIRSYLDIRLSLREARTVFLVLPCTYATALILVGAINPEYFRYSMIKIPIIADIEYEYENEKRSAISYNVTSGACFVNTVDELPVGRTIHIRVSCFELFSPPIRARVVWDNHSDPNRPAGSVLRITERPEGFYSFLLRYYLVKYLRGISFNLHLPGFETIRRFFVRAESVMQQTEHFPAGTFLFYEGDDGDDFYLIRKGKVDIFKQVGDEQVLLTTLGEDDVLGELALAGDQPRAATAVCKTDCILAVGHPDKLDALVESNPEFTRRLIKMLATRLVASENTMVTTNEQAEARHEMREQIMYAGLHTLLIGLGHHPRFHLIEAPINYDLIAAHLNMSPGGARLLFRFLMRYEETRDLDFVQLQRILTHEVFQIYNQYRLVIEESEPFP